MLKMNKEGPGGGWVLFLFLIVAGCSTSHSLRTTILHNLPPNPPIPLLHGSLEEGELTVAGSGLPHARVDLLQNGTLLENGTISAEGKFDLQVSPLLTDQVISATQTIYGRTSRPSQSVVVKRARLMQLTITSVLPPRIEDGQTLTFTGKGVFSNGRTKEPLSAMTWLSSNPNVATIDADGTFLALTAGATTIHATREGVTSELLLLTVQPLPPVLLSTLKGGDTKVAGTAKPAAQVQLHKNGTLLGAPVQADAAGQWEVSDLPMLTEADEITSTQVVNAIASEASSPVMVGPAVLTQITLAAAPTTIIDRGEMHRFTATGTFSNGHVKETLLNVIWQSNDPTVATIDENGVATGIDVGTTTIQATRKGVTSDLGTFTVQPLPPEIKPSLKAGDIIVTGSADPSAFIQLHMNGTPLGTPVQADAQGNWQAIDLQKLKEDDRVTSTQTINKVQSSLSTVVQVLPNHPPVFDKSLSDQKIRFGNTLNINLSATDLDSDSLTYKILTKPLPPNSQWNPSTRLFTFTPTADQVGTIPLTFHVSDGVSVHKKTIRVDVVLPRVVIILLNNEEGTVGKINVSSASETFVLDQSGQAITMSSSKEVPSQPFLLKDDVIQKSFHRALGAHPEKPLKYIVFFESDTIDISPKSLKKFKKFRTAIATSIASRVAPNIKVIGHTDRMASEEHNYDLSVRRALVIRDALIAEGIDSQLMEFTGHGEKNLLVKTPDGVSEPLNRRVEIYVR